MKKLPIFLGIIISYHLVVYAYLFQSGPHTLTAYYLFPSISSGEGLFELPPALFGEKVSLYILKYYKHSELKNIIDKKEVDLASIMLMADNMLLTREVDTERTLQIAQIYIDTGLSVNECVYGIPLIKWLEKIGALTPKNELFLKRNGFVDSTCIQSTETDA